MFLLLGSPSSLGPSPAPGSHSFYLAPSLASICRQKSLPPRVFLESLLHGDIYHGSQHPLKFWNSQSHAPYSASSVMSVCPWGQRTNTERAFTGCITKGSLCPLEPMGPASNKGRDAVTCQGTAQRKDCIQKSTQRSLKEAQSWCSAQCSPSTDFLKKMLPWESWESWESLRILLGEHLPLPDTLALKYRLLCDAFWCFQALFQDGKSSHLPFEQPLFWLVAPNGIRLFGHQVTEI